MTYVLGLDPSLESTGWATIARTDELLSAGCGEISTKRDSSTWPDRHTRIQAITDRVIAGTDNPTIAIIEGPAYSRGSQNGTWDRAGLWWSIYSALTARGIPIAVVTPGTRAKFGCGRGNAGKAEVAVGVSRLWPDIDARTDNEFDALALATMGAQWLGWNVPSRAHHAAALAAVAWPTRDDATAQQIAQAG